MDNMDIGRDCLRCVKRGKPWSGSDPKCAFRHGFFQPYNWNCATANAFRDIATSDPDQLKKKGIFAWSCRDDDLAGSLGVICIPANENNIQGYVVMSWYKSRGSTGSIWIFNDDDQPRPITLVEAEVVLRSLGE